MYKKQILIIISLSAVILQTCSSSPVTQTVAPSTATATILPSTPTQTEISSPTKVPLPTPISIPLMWRLVNDGQDFDRDTVTNIAIDPNDSNVLYVHMQNAGYYKSIDGGNSWQPIRMYDIPGPIISELDTETNQWEFEVSNRGPDGKTRRYRFDGQFWYVFDEEIWRRFTGTPSGWRGNAFNLHGEIFVYCSEQICKFDPDAKEMKRLGKPDVGVGIMLLVSQKDPNIIYAGGTGMAVSKDGGYSWTKLNNGLGVNNLFLVVDAQTANLLYLQLGECNRRRERSTMEQPLYRSIDGGITWEFLDYRGCFLIKDADGETLYRLATEADNYDPWIWQLSNKGLRWDKIFIPSAITTLATRPNHNGVLYAFDDRTPQNKYISENYGYTWKRDTSGSIKLCYGSTMHFIDDYKPMAIDPLDGNHVFVIEHGLLLESHDSCDTTKTFAIAINASMNTIAFDPNKSGTLYAGTDQGAYISFDSGATWNQINEGLIDTKIVYSIVVDKDGNVYAATPFGVFKLEGK